MATVSTLLKEKDRRLTEALMCLVRAHSSGNENDLRQVLLNEIETLRADWMKSYPQLETLPVERSEQPIIRTNYLGKAKAVFAFIAAPFRDTPENQIERNSLMSELNVFDKKLHRQLVQYAVSSGLVPPAYQGYVGSILWECIVKSREVWINNTLPDLIGEQGAHQLLRQPIQGTQAGAKPQPV